MGRVWILDTETKGTGANMVPLDSVVAKPSAPREPMVARRRPRERPAEEPEPKRPPEFKVVDVMTREVLAEGANARTTVELLRGVRSMVDVSVYVWEEQAQKWQQLTQREQRMLWDLR
jgi:hypothetical protein